MCRQEAEWNLQGYVTVMKTQADNRSETEALDAIGRVKGHNPLDPYISARGGTSTSRHRPLQCEKKTAVLNICAHHIQTSTSWISFSDFLSEIKCRVQKLNNPPTIGWYPPFNSKEWKATPNEKRAEKWRAASESGGESERTECVKWTVINVE